MTNPGEQEPPDPGLVRPYVITNGRELPENDTFSLITLVTVAVDEPAPRNASPEKRKLWDLCSGGYLSVAEITGHMQMPIGIVKILLVDLAEDGHLLTRAAPPPAQLVETHILREVLHGLQARFG